MKRIHLYASFVVLLFLSGFFISGAVMVMPDFFPRKTLNTRIEKIAVDQNNQTRVIDEIRRQYHILGKETIKETAGQKSYSYKRPGYRTELIFMNGKDSALIKISGNNLPSAMNDFHRLHGYDGNWINKTWALMYDLCCLALIVFAFTGVYLWWKLERKKVFGLLFFFVSTGLTVFSVWYLMAIG